MNGWCLDFIVRDNIKAELVTLKIVSFHISCLEFLSLTALREILDQVDFGFCQPPVVMCYRHEYFFLLFGLCTLILFSIFFDLNHFDLGIISGFHLSYKFDIAVVESLV